MSQQKIIFCIRSGFFLEPDSFWSQRFQRSFFHDASPVGTPQTSAAVEPAAAVEAAAAIESTAADAITAAVQPSVEQLESLKPQRAFFGRRRYHVSQLRPDKNFSFGRKSEKMSLLLNLDVHTIKKSTQGPQNFDISKFVIFLFFKNFQISQYKNSEPLESIF